jgi:pantetheine-phosphate adenylyltransferase
MRFPIAVYPGSFDPPTNGHLDIIARAQSIFPQLIVAVTNNSSKSVTFTIEERYRMLKDCTKKFKNVRVETFKGLLVDYAKARNAKVVIRGLREMSDFEYEFQLALMNRRLNRNIESVFLMPEEQYIYISSSMIKEIASHGGPLKGFVPPLVEKFLIKKYSKGGERR